MTDPAQEDMIDATADDKDAMRALYEACEARGVPGGCARLVLATATGASVRKVGTSLAALEKAHLIARDESSPDGRRGPVYIIRPARLPRPAPLPPPDPRNTRYVILPVVAARTRRE